MGHWLTYTNQQRRSESRCQRSSDQRCLLCNKAMETYFPYFPYLHISRHPLHKGLVQYWRPRLFRTGRNQYHAAWLLAVHDIAERLRSVMPPLGPLRKTWRHSRNRKCITYYNAVREGLSHGHRKYARKIWLSSADVWFLRYASGHTDRQTDRYAHRNIPLPYLGHWVMMVLFFVGAGVDPTRPLQPRGWRVNCTFDWSTHLHRNWRRARTSWTSCDHLIRVCVCVAIVTLHDVLKPLFHGSSFIAQHARNLLRGCYEDVGRRPRSACHALTWLVGQRSVAEYCCPFVVSFSKFHEPDTLDLLRTRYRHARLSWHVEMVWKSLTYS